MPLLGKYTCRNESKSGTTLEFEYELRVNTAGLFSVYIPNDTIVRRLENVGVTFQYNGTGSRRIKVLTDVTRGGVLRKLHDGVDKLTECETIEEDVIKYSFSANCHYVIGPEGEIRPTGAYQEGGFLWNKAKTDSSCWTPNYSVGFYAYVAKKVTYRSDGIERVEYKYHPSDVIGTEEARLLNSFVSVPTDDNHLELPYSPDIAMAFYNMMLSLCHVNQRIQAFFEEPEHVLAAIKDQKALPIGN